MSSKFTVEEIEIPDQQMQELNKMLTSLITDKSKSRNIRAVIGGNCTSCYGIPTKILRRDVGDDSKVVEYYCDKCFERWIEKEKEQ